ncbi:protein psiQ-like [Topomyia yanbarensis]|uniref:protein psiQ-like n=1 Tax=Topomyia yanbarensis TaxID=2498891 RepID=UPI00273B63E0|nr:protein psiQ-like [Topomyia yanbarensis]
MIFKSCIIVITVGAICISTVKALNCNSCTGTDCVTSVGTSVLCSGSSSVEKCYTKFSGYRATQRGCWSALSSSEQGLCPGIDCETCTEDNCNQNSRSTHKCVVCSSSTNADCLSAPTNLQATQCAAPSTDVTENQCFSRMTNGIASRGCVQSQNDITSCTGSPPCETCAGQGCNIGSYQKCVKCSGSACNGAITTSNCDLPSDNCAIVQNNDGTLTKNCEKSLSDTDKSFCGSNPTKCFYCGIDECNKGDINLQTSPKCYTCEGTDCLRSKMEIETCHNIDDSCFTIFDGFNPVRRGCRSALSAQNKATCDNANDVSCDLCTGDVCNLKSRSDHKCQYCSSVVSEGCVASPNSPVQCPAPTTEVSDEGQCYTRVIGNVTERGCLGSAVNALECKSPENCQMCAIQGGTACNTAVFPASRRKCVVGSTRDQYCSDPNDSCVQMMQGTTRSKKCKSAMSATEVAFCQANSNKCDFCSSGDNCNSQDKTFNYLDCLSCDSSTDSRCTSNPGAITTIQQCSSCVTRYSNTSRTVRRGCLTTSEQCQASTSSGDMCSSCTANRCNSAIYPTGRLACYSCQGGSCFSHDSIKLEYCPMYQQGDSCIVQFDSSYQLLRMGCRSSLSTSEATTCSSNSELCKTCSTAECNEPSAHMPRASCVQCNSATDINCIERAQNYEAEPCNDPLNTQCYSRLVMASLTQRGCVSDLDSTSKTQCSQGYRCSLCASASGKCNSQAYPAGWIKCYQCDSSQDASCKNAQTGTVSYCSTYDSANACYTIVQQSGATVRKCSSQSRAVQCAGADRCEVCLFNGCNNRVSTAVMSMNETTTTTTPAPGAANRVIDANLVMVLLLVITFVVRLPVKLC